MEPLAKTAALYEEATVGNPAARAFLDAWNNYCHSIDDFIDLKENDFKTFLRILVHANMLYSMPFYQEHTDRLHPLVVLITNNYADSIEWASKHEDWRRNWADTLRFAGNEMVTMVAYLCGGMERMRDISLNLRDLAWSTHHSPEGKAQ